MPVVSKIKQRVAYGTTILVCLVKEELFSQGCYLVCFVEEPNGYVRYASCWSTFL